MFMFVKKSVGAKITVCITCLLLVALSTLSLISYNGASSSLTNSMQSNMQSTTNLNAKLISEKLNFYKKEAQDTASKKSIQSMDWALQEPVLAQDAKADGFLKMGIADLNGSARYSDKTSTNISERQYFMAAAQGITTVSDPLISTANNKFVMVFATPIRNSQGNIVGVLTATANGQLLSDIVKSIKQNKTGYGYVLNSVGNTIAHKDENLVRKQDNIINTAKKDPALRELAGIDEKMIKGQSGFESYNYKGTEKLIAYTPIPDTTWSLGLTVEKNDSMSMVNAMRSQYICLSLIILLAAIVILIILTKRMIQKPLQKTAHMIRELSLGSLDDRLSVNTIDEIGVISGSMNELADSMQAIAGQMSRVSRGDTTVTIEPRSENDILSISIKKVVDTINNVTVEVDKLVTSAEEGNYSLRGDAEKFSGKYEEMVKGINQLLDKVMESFDEVTKAGETAQKRAAYQKAEIDKIVVNLKRLSEGKLFCDLSVAAADEDTGDLQELFNNISNNLHESISGIKGYIDELSDVLGHMADGRFDIEITGEYKGDFIEIKNSINHITETLSAAFSKINAAAVQVAVGSKQVADGSQELSRGAVEQESTIEELNATVSDIAEQTRKNAGNANQAKDLADKAKNAAVIGNEDMKHMLGSINEISAASGNISKIVKVIDSIAFQTNMLALNAAVEAARAGQYGKGFAVVAEEVRNLASRSAESVKETTEMIEQSLQKVEEGKTTADKTAQALDHIVKSVDAVVGLVASISAASDEQASGIDQVNQGISNVASVVQTNSATAEQSAASSEELTGQAELLKKMVGQFRLKPNGQAQKETAEIPPRTQLQAASASAKY